MVILKGSYDVAKKNIILCIWCNAMCLCGLKFKKHIIFRLSETRWSLQSSSFQKARCMLIAQLSSALWVAEFFKHVTEMLCPLP